MLSGKLDNLPNTVLDHVESCEMCHAEIVELFSILSQIETQSQSVSGDGGKSRIINLKPIYRLALVAAVTALAIFFYFRDNPNLQHQSVQEIAADTSSAANDNTLEIAEENTSQKPAPNTGNPLPDQENPPISNEPEQDQLYAANFSPSDDYEALIGTTVRSAAVTDIAPKAGSHFNRQEIITFSWDLEKSDLFYVTILNNREEIIIRQEINGSEFSTSKLTTPGLYYWKLENDAEILYVGKILIDQ
ncbi:MAG: hypothetical protein DWQ02_13545 [Bacteroidetes bacterium]|nr:MAG: hypothetical protein DWQ02_13545 [Bacteroidota bacterium]